VNNSNSADWQLELNNLQLLPRKSLAWLVWSLAPYRLKIIFITALKFWSPKIQIRKDYVFFVVLYAISVQLCRYSGNTSFNHLHRKQALSYQNYSLLKLIFFVSNQNRLISLFFVFYWPLEYK
jgi:hypothetical protein